MPRQSVSLTEPNVDWLKAQIENKEYTSITDAINDLIRQARRKEEAHLERVRAMLAEAEQSVKNHGYSDKTPAEIRTRVLQRKGLDDGL
jgi:antitoxin ParD1/3/4